MKNLNIIGSFNPNDGKPKSGCKLFLETLLAAVVILGTPLVVALLQHIT